MIPADLISRYRHHYLKCKSGKHLNHEHHQRKLLKVFEQMTEQYGNPQALAVVKQVLRTH